MKYKTQAQNNWGEYEDIWLPAKRPLTKWLKALIAVVLWVITILLWKHLVG